MNKKQLENLILYSKSPKTVASIKLLGIDTSAGAGGTLRSVATTDIVGITETLDQVTTSGATTTNDITVGDIAADAITGDSVIVSGAVTGATYGTAAPITDAQLGNMMTKNEVQTYTKQQYFVAVEETVTTVLAWNLDNAQSHIITIDSAVTITPTNMESGSTYVLVIKQDATGSRLVTWDAAFLWAGGIIPTLSTAANAIDLFTFSSDGTNLFGTYANNFS
jgi:hypothetical protein